MAEAATTPEKETETVAVEGMVALPASAPASVPTVNPTSPVEVKEDQVDKEADLPVQEPPEKRARTSLEDELRKLMERTREGYDLTAAALEKVQQHLDISRQFGQDLTQLAQDVHCNKVGAKYQLAQLQQVLSSFQNLEWQVGGSKQESNTSIKSLVNKLLAASTTSKEALKSIHGELREGNDKLIQAINDGFEKMTTALQGISLPGKETAGFPPGFPPAPTAPPTGTTICCPTVCCTTTSNAGGTICDIDIWNARVCLELCGCTAQYSSDTTSGTQGTSGIVDFYATCSNWGRNGIESATITAFDFDGGR